MSAPHDRPEVAELIAAVREFLERDVMSATEGRVQFHTRVAVNALGMVERELLEGEVIAAEHAARLHALGYDDDRELAAAIRSGDVDRRWDAVTRAVYETVVDKLRVANPQHLVDDEGGGSPQSG
jgi:Domain of unknown function (DUF6285)